MLKLPYIDWPDIPFVDFPNLPSPGKILENVFETVAKAMRDDGIRAINATIKLLADGGSMDIKAAWIDTLLSKVFGLALVLTIFVSVVLFVIESLSRRITATERMVMAAIKIPKMLAAGYLTLTAFAVILYGANLLTEMFAGIATTGNSGSAVDEAFTFANVGSLFGALISAGALMMSAGTLYIQIQGYEYMLIPLALSSLLFYTVKSMGVWGERFWKLFVSFVFACAFTRPIDVLVMGMTTQVVANNDMPPVVQNIFLLWAVWFCSVIPLLIMLLTYVGYTIQLGKSKAEVEGKVETMSSERQREVYRHQVTEQFQDAQMAARQTPRAAANSSSAHKSHIARDHIKAAARQQIDAKIAAADKKATTVIDTQTAAIAGQVASAVGGPLGAAGAVIVTGIGKSVSDRTSRTIRKRGERQ